MPRQANISIQNSFVKGLITEATGLNFPENACVETFDCIFDKTGEVYRRPGLDFEDNFDTSSSTITDSAISEFLWKGVSKNGEITFVVLQIGNILSFFKAASDQTISTAKQSFTVDISDFKVTGAPETATLPCSFASGNGLLFVGHAYCNPFYIEYSDETNDITTTQIDVKIRDVKGLDNKNSSGNLVDVDHRVTQSELSKEISYNLLNQGWYAVSATTRYNTNFQINNVLAYFYSLSDTKKNVGGDQTKVYPAESEIWWVYKAPVIPLVDDAGNPITVDRGITEAFSVNEFTSRKDRFGSTQAPKGHYILDAFNIDRSDASADDVEVVNTANFDAGNAANVSTAGIDIESAGYQRPSQIAFYAGRVFYAGTNSSGFNTRIYFSQILDGAKNVEKAYQQQDPTSEQASDLLPTDGGIVEIPDVAQVVKLFTYGNSLFVFATNGVWAINGSQGLGFTATDYSVTKVSSTPALSATSFVDVDGAPMWWNTDGIWTLQASNQIAAPSVVSLTNTTIQSFFEDIPSTSKIYAKGCFNPFTRIVQWVYRSTEEPVPAEGADPAIAEHYKYDRVLNLDMTTGAFYPWTIPDTCLQIAGIICLQGTAVDTITRDVTVEGVNVTVNAVDVTSEEVLRSVMTSSVFKYIVVDTCSILTGGGAAAGLTFNSGFIDSLDSSFDANSLEHRNLQTVCVGLDDKIYIPCSAGAANDKFAVLDSFTSLSSYSITNATLQSDINTEVGGPLSSSDWNTDEQRILPFPYSPYYYVFTNNAPVGANVDAAFALYKILGDGSHEFQGVRIWNVLGRYFLGNLKFCGVGYKGNGDDPLTHKLLVAVSGDNTNSMGGFVLELPSVNELASVGNDTLNPSDDETDFLTHVHGIDDAGIFYRGDTITGITSGNAADDGVFFLPKLTGDTWSNIVCVPINKSVIDYYIAHPTSPGAIVYSDDLSTIIQANSTSKGFVITRSLDGTTWSVNAELGPPFGDEGEDRDGSAAANNNGFWVTPSVRYDSTNDEYLLTWTRRFDATEDNLTPTGAYAKVAVLAYDPSSQTAALIGAIAAGNTYDVVDDLGISELKRYSYCPYNTFAFWNDDNTELYLYAYNFDFAADDTTVVTKFGDFSVPNTDVADISFAEFNNDTTYSDWDGDEHETDYTSYLITGYKLRGEAIRKFQNNYIRFYTRNENPSSFDFYGRWDFANQGSTGRWGQVQRVVMTNNNTDYNTRRLKVRGNGLALNIKVSSVTGQPFNIIGWANFETGNAAP